MSVDKDTVRKIAHLARIRVEDKDLDHLESEINTILDWVEQLGEVDTDGVAPMTSVADMKLRWREDVINDGGIQDKLMTNAPEGDDGFFAVPKVVE